MTHSVFAALQAIEEGAQRAVVQELRLMVEEVSALRLFCSPDEGEYADALLLKLFRLIEEQEVPAAQPLGASQVVPECAVVLPLDVVPIEAVFA